MAEIEVKIARDFESFLDMREPWDRMVNCDFHAHPFLKHFWFVNYYRAYFNKLPILVFAAYENDRMIGALPMILVRKRMAGIPLRQARFIAGAHSYIKRLLIPPDKPNVLALFLEALMKEDIDLVYFESDTEFFSPASSLEDFCLHNKFNYEIWSGMSSPFITVSGSFPDFQKTLSRNLRGSINNRMNRVSRAGGYEVKAYDQPDQFDDVVRAIEEISRNSWQGQQGSGLFSNENNSSYYRNLILHSLEHGYGKAFILYLDNKPAAYEYHISHGHTEYCLKAEFSQQYNSLSPGAVLELELIKQAFASEVEIYDLLGSADAYKLKWTHNLKPYSGYYIFNRSFSAFFAHLLRFSLRKMLKRVKCFRIIGNYLRKSS